MAPTRSADATARRGSSPTLETLALFVVVYLLQRLVGLFGWATSAWLFVLAPPLSVRPWTLVTSVYAHAGLGHLLANALALLAFGLLVERVTTRLRFHAFFVGVGALAGAAQVLATGALGARVGVLGASGAVFGLLGYLLAGNRLSASAFGRIDLSPRIQLALFALLAVAVTVATAAPGVALVAHFTGLLAGLVAGRLRLLHVAEDPPRVRSTSYK